MKIMKSLVDLDVLTDGVTNTVKHGTKQPEGGFFGALLPPLAALLVEPVISSVVKGIIGWVVRRAGREYWIKIVSPLHPLNKVEITNYFNYEPRFNDLFSRNNLPRIKDGAFAINIDDKRKWRNTLGFINSCILWFIWNVFS